MTFTLPRFLPYLLNQAAEAASAEFQAYYKARYGMLRTEWRVLFHLGIYGDMTASEVCTRAAIHKTKVSRAVAALEAKRFVKRRTDAEDRRNEPLSLTPAGTRAFTDLQEAAAAYEARLTAFLSEPELDRLRAQLEHLASQPVTRSPR